MDTTDTTGTDEIKPAPDGSPEPETAAIDKPPC